MYKYSKVQTFADAKICWTAADISGPIPSPGINVTLVDCNRTGGLKMNPKEFANLEGHWKNWRLKENRNDDVG